MIDIFASCLQQQKEHQLYGNDDVSSIEDENELDQIEGWESKRLRREFTVMSDRKNASDLLTFEIKDIIAMRAEFPRVYEDLFKGKSSELQKTISVKLYAMDHCNKQFTEYVRKRALRL